MGGFPTLMAFFVSAYFWAEQVLKKAMDELSVAFFYWRLLKNAHLLRFLRPSSLLRTSKVRLSPTHQLVGVARCRSLFVAMPLSGLPA